jgi:hypothetical protein
VTGEDAAEAQVGAAHHGGGLFHMRDVDLADLPGWQQRLLRGPPASPSASVTGRVDVRGTLLMDPEVRVGFDHLTCRVTVQPVPGTDPGKLRSLLAIVERTCVNLDTIRHASTVEMMAGPTGPDGATGHASDQVETGGVRHGDRS